MEIQYELLQCKEEYREHKTEEMECSSTADIQLLLAKPKNGDQSQTKKKVTNLSRNLLILICEFLNLAQTLRLAMSNSTILKKLDWQGPQEQLSHDNASYIKRRGAINLQTFFFQQFPSADESFYKRMNGLIMRNSYFATRDRQKSNENGTFIGGSLKSVISNSKETNYKNNGLPLSSSSYLPFIKQSSICEEKLLGIVSPSCIQKQDSFNPFEIASETYQFGGRGSTVTTAFTDQTQDGSEVMTSCKPSYLQNLFDKWKDMYMEALENKRNFVQTHNQAFYTAFLQDSNAFAREIFLDPSQCENPRFALPQLIRENFHQKGLWYRTEKILVQNFSNCFQRSTVDHTKNVLWDLSQRLQNELAKDDHARSVLVSMLFFSPQKNIGEKVVETTEFNKHQCQAEMDDHEILGNLTTPQFNKGNDIFMSFIAPQLQGKNQNFGNIPSSFELPKTQPLLLPQPKKATIFDLCQPELSNIEDLDLDSLEVPTLPTLNARQPTVNAPVFPSFSFNHQQPLQLQKEFELPKEQFPIPSLQKGNFGAAFEMVGFDSTNRVFTGKEQEITQMYKDVCSYILRQFKLLCNAHRWQLQFVLEQIKLAPAIRRSFYPFLEDYVEKERNLRYMLRKLSQNFILQESFTETMLRENVFQAKETQKQPYLCDFLMLEFLDSMWINEIYRNQRLNLWKIVKQEIEDLHTIERFRELESKKPVIKKIVNLIHQTEFNLESNFDFLSISNVQNEQKVDTNGNQFLQVPQVQRSSFTSQQSHGTSQGIKIYEDLSRHIKVCVERFLKNMSEKSKSASEFMDLCGEYEKYEFHKFMETDYFYLKRKKYYLGVAFANEFALKLENNKFVHSRGGSSSTASTSASVSESRSGTPISPSTQKYSSSSQYQNLSLTQIMHIELSNTYFHSLLQRILREGKYKCLLSNDELLQSLFVLFHIEQNSRSQFASDINKQLIKINSDIEELIAKYPEVIELDQTNEVEEVLKIVKGDCTDEACQQHHLKTPGISVEASPFPDVACGQKNSVPDYPSSLIDCQLSAEDEEFVLRMIQSDQISLNRGYSEQKRDYQMSFSQVIFEAFLAEEAKFDFQKLIEEERVNERKRVMDEITQRIENYNQALYQFNQNSQQAAATTDNNNDAGGDTSQQKLNIDQIMEDVTQKLIHNEAYEYSQMSQSQLSQFDLGENEEQKFDSEGKANLPMQPTMIHRSYTTADKHSNISQLDHMTFFKLQSSNEKQQTSLKPTISGQDQTNTAATFM